MAFNRYPPLTEQEVADLEFYNAIDHRSGDIDEDNHTPRDQFDEWVDKMIRSEDA